MSKTVEKDGKTESVTNLKSTNPTDGSPEFTTLDILVNMAEYLIQDDKLNSKSNSKSNKRMRAGRPPVATRMSGGMIRSGTVVINLPNRNRNSKRNNKNKKRSKTRRN